MKKSFIKLSAALLLSSALLLSAFGVQILSSCPVDSGISPLAVFYVAIDDN